MVYPAIDLDRLTVGERLELIEQVWDSLRRGADVLPLSDAERAVIEARRAEHRDDPTAAVAWKTVRADLVGDQEADEQRARAAKRVAGMRGVYPAWDVRSSPSSTPRSPSFCCTPRCTRR